MRNRIILLLVLAGFFMLGGCTLSVFNKERRVAIWEGMKQDVHEWNQFMDQFLFNYDEDDPNRY